MIAILLRLRKIVHHQKCNSECPSLKQGIERLSGEGVSQRVEMTKHPNSPPPIWNEKDAASGPSRTTIAEENEGTKNTFYDPSKPTLNVSRRAPAPKPYKEEIYSQPGISPVSSEVEVVQPDFNDSEAKESAEESSEGFESLNPVKKFHLPATEEEEDLASTNGSSSIPKNEEADVEMIRYFWEERMILTLRANLGELGTESTSFRVPRAKYLIELDSDIKKIDAWEIEQIAKANKHKRLFQEKTDKKIEEEQKRAENKIARAHKKAEDKKKVKRVKFDAEPSQLESDLKKVDAWQSEQIAKANEHKRLFERKIDKKKEEEERKLLRKKPEPKKKAEDRKVAKRSKFETEPSLADRIRSKFRHYLLGFC